jgi:aubergine-like protein
VNRKHSTRFFKPGNRADDVVNPGPGTVVDMALVEKDGDTLFDFFMIPHNATVATAQPVHFNVIHNSTNLSKDKIEHTAYHLCYNYVGFTGPIKVPAVCMYANKIANYVHSNKIKETNKILSNNLHFL